MRAVTRRVFEMCVRVLAVIAGRPDDEPGMVILVGELKALVARMSQVITDQRAGRMDARAAATRKDQLRNLLLAGPIAHLARIGVRAAGTQHTLASLFTFRPTARTTLAFQTAARAMLADARTHLDILVQHGLSASVLAQFEQLLDEFDAAVALGAQGRIAHTAATAELVELTREATRIVRAMDARNRLRFAADRQAFEEWVSASRVLGTPQESKDQAAPPAADGSASQPASGAAGAGGEASPAA
jgi:hypothetical protein